MSVNAKNCLYFFYDFEVEPVTYDFAWALGIANARRIELGLTHLKIIFVPGSFEGLRKETADYEIIIDHEARSWRVYSILLPITRLLTCPYDVILCSTRIEANSIYHQAQFVYPTKYNVTFPVAYSPKQAIAYAHTFKCFQAEEQSRCRVLAWLKRFIEDRKLIVVTLRQYAYTPVRNSNIEAWAQFAHYIDKKKYALVFVPDTEQALQNKPSLLSHHNFYDAASWDLMLRAALYELAYLNLGVNTGPMSLCWLNSDCRYITFKTITANAAQASLAVMLSRGFVFNENPKFAGKYQKWLWCEDDYQSIVSEFGLMCEIIG